MKSIIHSQFSKMDELAAKKTPFFFVVDFKMEHIEVYKVEELDNAGILVDFPNFRSFLPQNFLEKSLVLKSHSETLEEYQPGIEIVQNNLKTGNSYLTN